MDNNLEISKEDVPQFEQVAIIKFLAKEQSPDYEIFCRLQKVYKERTFSMEMVASISSRFYENSPTALNDRVFDDCKDVVKLNVTEDGEVFHLDPFQHFESLPTNSLTHCVMENTTRSNKRTLSTVSVPLNRRSKKAYLQTFKEEVPDIELEYVDLEDNQGTCSIEEAVFEKGIFDEDQIDGIDLEKIKLPFLPVMGTEKAINVLMKLHVANDGDLKCRLCDPKDFQFQSSLRRHLLLAHAKRTVQLDGLLSVRCRRSCVKYAIGHFHCSKCIKAFVTQSRLFVHYQRHFFKGLQGTKGSKPTALLETKVIHTRCICVDRGCGLYMVQKSDFGSMTPIHVLKTKTLSQCSDVLCQKAMSIAIKQNNTGFECKHLQRVSWNQNYKAEISNLDVELLDSTNDRRQECVDLLQFADRKHVSAVVEWRVSAVLYYYSVISSSNLDWCYRTMVQYLPNKDSSQCCSCITASCVHCDLVALYVNNY